MAEQQSLQSKIARLVSSQLLAVLATQEAGQPYTSLIAVACADDLSHLFFATARNTRKFKNIEADSRVALLWDDRSNRAADLEAATAVTAIGSVRELAGDERNRAARTLLSRHPSLAPFVALPTTALLGMSVSRYILVGHFQDVMVLDLEVRG